jgi:hypothetical protein
LQGTIAPAATWSAPAPVSVGAGILLLAFSARWTVTRAGAWTWRRTGIWVGATAALAWPVSAAAGRGFGLAVVPGTTGLLSGVGGHPLPAWDGLLVLGILGGGWLAARRNGPSRPKPALLLKRPGRPGPGSAHRSRPVTVGGAQGLPLLAPSSFLVMASIFAGSALSTLAARRSEKPPTRAVS